MTSTYSSNKTGITFSSYKDVTYVENKRPEIVQESGVATFEQADGMPPHHSFVDELFGINQRVPEIHFEPPEGYHTGSQLLFRNCVMNQSGGLANHPFVKVLNFLNETLKKLRYEITRFQKG